MESDAQNQSECWLLEKESAREKSRAGGGGGGQLPRRDPLGQRRCAKTRSKGGCGGGEGAYSLPQGANSRSNYGELNGSQSNLGAGDNHPSGAEALPAMKRGANSFASLNGEGRWRESKGSIGPWDLTK